VKEQRKYRAWKITINPCGWRIHIWIAILAFMRERGAFTTLLGSSLCGLVMRSACSVVIGDTGDPGSQEEFVGRDPSDVALGSSPVSRLTNVEYENTVRDLFGSSIPDMIGMMSL